MSPITTATRANARSAAWTPARRNVFHSVRIVNFRDLNVRVTN